jgi:hypothetical protein
MQTSPFRDLKTARSIEQNRITRALLHVDHAVRLAGYLGISSLIIRVEP